MSSITGQGERGASHAEVEVRVARHRQARLTTDEISQLPQLNDESPNLWKNERSAIARDLLSAAVRCFAANGYHGTTTRDVSQLVGLSPAALYVHFPSK